MPATTNYDIMDGKFGSGPGGDDHQRARGRVQNYRSKGINFGVAPLPTLPNGKAPTPFVGVQMLGVNSRSKNAEAAWDLVRYLSINLPLPLYRASGRVPATVAASNARIVKANPVTQVVIASSNHGPADAEHPRDGLGLDAGARASCSSSSRARSPPVRRPCR